jgi:uncharacterized integral membrane protein
MAERQDSVERRSPAQIARIALAVILLAVGVAVVVDNRVTRIGYIFGDIEAPLIVVLLLAVVGALIGWLLLHRSGTEISQTRVRG